MECPPNVFQLCVVQFLNLFCALDNVSMLFTIDTYTHNLLNLWTESRCFHVYGSLCATYIKKAIKCECATAVFVHHDDDGFNPPIF